MEEIKSVYIKYKGSMDKILSVVVGADVENENRYVNSYHIVNGRIRRDQDRKVLNNNSKRYF
jgi:hypothetical protein